MILPGKGAVRKETALNVDRLKGAFSRNIRSNDKQEKAAADAEKERERQRNAILASENDMTPEEKAAQRQGNAPPITEAARLRRRGSRTGAVLATGGNGSTLG